MNESVVFVVVPDRYDCPKQQPRVFSTLENAKLFCNSLVKTTEKQNDDGSIRYSVSGHSSIYCVTIDDMEQVSDEN